MFNILGKKYESSVQPDSEDISERLRDAAIERKSLATDQGSEQTSDPDGDY